MKPDPKRIRQLFCRRPWHGRSLCQLQETFLEGESGGDPELLGEVRLLLEAHREAGSFLKRPVVESALAGASGTLPLGATQNPATNTLESPGTVIGPYKLLQSIGEGGMGTVYMAEQTQPVRRTVRGSSSSSPACRAARLWRASGSNARRSR